MTNRRGKKATASAPPPPYQPTEQDRVLVQIGTGAGVGAEFLRSQIAGGRLTKAEFEAVFAAEISHGGDAANIKVAANLFRMATAWPPIKGVTPTAAIFWLKSRAGWGDSSAAGNATVTIADQPAKGSDDAPAPGRIIEVAFKIGDDSRIRDEDP